MAEETTDPVQTEPVPAPADSTPAAPPPVPAPAASTPAEPASSKQGSPLLVFLTVLLVLVGITDAILWGIVGYSLLRNAQSGDGTVTIQSAPASGEPTNSGTTAGGGESGGDTEKQDALRAYIQEMDEVWKLGHEVQEGYGSVSGTNFTDYAATYAEITEHALPLCQRVKEMSDAIVPSDPEIAEVHGIYRDNVTKYLSALTTMSSALSNQDAAQGDEANDLFTETIDLAANYDQAIERLAEERNVTLNS